MKGNLLSASFVACAVASAAVAQTNPWVEYNGPGELFVLKNGKVVAVPEAQVSDNQSVETGDQVLWLVDTGEVWTIMEEVTGTPKVKIKLESDAPNEAVLRFEGTLLVAEVGSGTGAGNWLVWAQDATTGDIFEVYYEPPFAEATAGGCTADCDEDGTPECTCTGTCLCWCGPITNRAYCLQLIPVIGVLAAPI